MDYSYERLPIPDPASSVAHELVPTRAPNASGVVIDHRSAPSRPLRRRTVLAAAAAGAATLAIGGALASRPALQWIESHAAPTADQAMAHLLRRAGFGASPQEMASYAALGFEGAVSKLLDDASSGAPPPVAPDNLPTSKRGYYTPHAIQQWWIQNMLRTTRPLQEKMTYFWHGLLTSSTAKAPTNLLVAQNQLFRSMAVADFGSIVKAVAMNPAMMLWLDTETNRKDHPNENFARELMELFTMGVGNYTEVDVREAARSFTGWTIRQHNYFFNARQHDFGSKTVLGQTGAFNGTDVIDIIVQTDASARYICQRLFSYFAYPNPSATDLQPIIAVYKQSGLGIKETLRAIFLSDAFRSAQAYRALIKSPVEYIVGALRTLGVSTEATPLPNILTLTGQTLFAPPNVAGWPGGPTWLNSGTWFGRVNYADLFTSARRQSPLGWIDVLSILRTYNLHTARDVYAYCSNVLLDGQVGATQAATLLDYITPPAGPTADLQQLALARWTDEHVRGLIYLMLAMPEYHLN